MSKRLPTLKVAEKIVGELSPFCDQIEIAGSIRRGLDWVNDIDIVALPKEGRENDFRERCKRAAKVDQDGPQKMLLFLANGWQLDIWIARPEKASLFETVPTNFGALLLCRTGSMDHNIFMVEHAKSIGCVLKMSDGVFRDGELIAGATELEIFKALNLEFIPPERRER